VATWSTIHDSILATMQATLLQDSQALLRLTTFSYMHVNHQAHICIVLLWNKADPYTIQLQEQPSLASNNTDQPHACCCQPTFKISNIQIQTDYRHFWIVIKIYFITIELQGKKIAHLYLFLKRVRFPPQILVWSVLCY